MKFIERNKKFVIIASLLLVSLLILIVVSAVNYQRKNATIIIQFAPTSASAFIDGKKAGENNRVVPGEYTVSVKKEGFDDYKRKVSVAENSEQTVYAVLVPNTEETRFWYENNEKDAQIRETIFFRDFSSGAEAAEREFPIMSVLPFLGPKRIYRIDYGTGSKPDTHALYITYYTPEAKQMALDWIKEKGYSIDDYEVFYEERDINDL